MAQKSYITRRSAVKVLSLSFAGALLGTSSASAKDKAALDDVFKKYTDILKENGITVDGGVRRKGYKLKGDTWEPVTYKLSYKTCGVSVPKGCPKTYTIQTPTFELPPAARRRYAFKGWYTCSEKPKRVKKIKEGSTGNMRLQAVWEVPSYWRAHLADRIEKINADIEAAGSEGDCFVFLTDVHEKTNTMHSPVLIQNIMLETPVRRLVFGGDVINWYSSRAKALGKFSSFKESLEFSDEVHYVRGNHDANQEDPRSEKYQRLSNAEIRECFTNKYMEKNAPSKDALYYFYDNKKSKIRYIFLDTGGKEGASMDSAQLAWAKQRVLELEEGWSVILFQHMLFRESGYSKKKDRHKLGVNKRQINGVLIRDLLDSIYSSARATIIGVICGHAHLDFAQRSSKGYWMVMTTTDAYHIANKLPETQKYGRHRRNPGTTREQAFDVVVIDKAARKIKMTRVGAGSDREFNY